VRKPLPLVLGLVAVVAALMLGGWALTSGAPDVPRGSAPAAGSDADAKRDATGGTGARSGSTGRRAQQAGHGPQAPGRKPAEAIRPTGAKARGAAQSSGEPSDERARRNGGGRAQRLRAEQAREAKQRRQSDATRRSAERRRAEQLRQENAARQAQAARRAEEAKRAQEDSPDEQRTHDGPEEE